MTTQQFVPVGHSRIMRDGSVSRRRPMNECILRARDDGAYMALYPNQKILDKGWEHIYVEVNSQMMRFRKATSNDAIRHVLRAAGNNRPERPHYVISTEDLGRMVIDGRQAVTEEPKFQDGWFYIWFPSTVSFES